MIPWPLQPALAAAAVLALAGGLWCLRPDVGRQTASTPAPGPEADIVSMQELRSRIATLEGRLAEPRPDRKRQPFSKHRNKLRVRESMSRIRGQIERTKNRWAESPPLAEQETRNHERNNA
jgi:hypothetical protein